MFGWLLLVALASGWQIHLAHRTIDASTVARRSEPAKFERGVFVVQFRAPIDAGVLHKLKAVLGYTPSEYVPVNSLVLFVNSTATGDRLTESLGTRINHFERLQRQDRRADIVAAVDEMRARDPGTEFRATRAGERQNAPSSPQTDQVRLRVRSFYGSLQEHAEDVDRAAKYVAQLSNSMQNLNSRVRPHVDDSAHHITVEQIDTDEAEQASDAILDGLDDVYWVEMITPYETLNRWSIPAVHRAADGEKSAAPSTTQSTAGWRPVLGLRGANQTIGVSDTGIENVCFFSDGLGQAAGAWPTIVGMSRVPADTNHPKIRAYSSGSGGDLRDVGPSAGHGTHVVGTIAGRASAGSQSAKYNGGAPDARIAFVDLMSSTSPALYVPDLTVLLQWFYDAGARVKSASWGASNGGRYTIDDRDVDAFVWRRREMLVVFAAGNAGKDASISTPGMNKNGLTIGATMNGYEAYSLAAKPPKSFSATSSRWLASFSSRGSATLPFAKPDLVAPGGYYVWSADNEAPLSGSCANEEQTTTGYAGTSMATPLVAATAALVYEAFQRNVTLLTEYGAGALPVYASLVRAVLAASGRPLDGIYPSMAYASASARRNAEGFGRVALDRSLGPTVSLVVLSNERAEHGLTRVSTMMRACLDVSSLAQGTTLAGHEIVVQLAYADYPSSIVSKASLVNNLDLVVKSLSGALFPVNYNAVNASETRTTLERVVVGSAQALEIGVRLSQLGFGTVQTFSLIAVLRPIAPTSANITRRLLASELTAAAGSCSVCNGRLIISGECDRCGDGVLGDDEQCETGSGPCCDTATCRWKSGDCTHDYGFCTVPGRCDLTSGVCAVNQTAVDRACRTSSVAVCAKTASTWLSAIRSNKVELGNTSDYRICCQQFTRYAYERAPTDPLQYALSIQYIAARLNLAASAASVAVVNAIRDAKQMLEAQCGRSKLSDRAKARGYIQTLTAYNEPSCASKAPSPYDQWCTAPLSAATDNLCSGAPNRYIEADARCECGALRQNEPDCSHLACNGRGSSIFDHTSGADRCVCMPGWSGSACDQCSEPVDASMRYLCVGTTASAQTAGSPRYLWRSVSSQSVGDRLSGVYYTSLSRKLGKSPAIKTADALPGGNLDCWCMTKSSAAFASHASAVENATAALATQLDWAASFEAEFSPTVSSSGVRAIAVLATGDGARAGLSVLAVLFALVQ